MTFDYNDPTPEQVQTVTCPTCKAGATEECTFVKNRRHGARRGEPMGGTCHPARVRAYEREHQ